MKGFTLTVAGIAALLGAADAARNPTMLQTFYFETSNAGTFWKDLATSVPGWVKSGITHFWLPPPFKGLSGIDDPGYGAYDLYDLGEFNQKGTTRTKYGTRDDFENAVKTIRSTKALSIIDIILNHKMGGDTTENVLVQRIDPKCRFNADPSRGEVFTTPAYTNFTFSGRRDANGALLYSSFTYTKEHFTAVDYSPTLFPDGCTDPKNSACRIYKIQGNSFATDVDTENCNYDFLLGNDLNVNHPAVRQDLKNWGKWFATTFQIDGFRLDAAKHVSYAFQKEFLQYVSANSPLTKPFSVAEYIAWSVDPLLKFIQNSLDVPVYDVPLRGRFQDAANRGGSYDMRTIFDGSMVKALPSRAVTFVESHDTLPGHLLGPVVPAWFKPHAYALTLLRPTGIPVVQIADYFGIDASVPKLQSLLDVFLKVRKFHAYGKFWEYLDNPDVIGWTFEGSGDHWYGAAVLMTDNRSSGGSKWMNMGSLHANTCYTEVTGKGNKICTNKDGWAEFTVPAGSVTVYVQEGKFGADKSCA